MLLTLKHLKLIRQSSKRLLSDFVKIVEVGPRDGLQNEKQVVPTSTKIDLVNNLTNCGFQTIEVTSFVSPKWVPQMKDHTEVLQGISRAASTKYAALTPNLKGFKGAQKANADEVAIFGAASESFSKKNINCSIQESLERFLPVVEAAKEHQIPVRGYVSCVVGCPYEGIVSPQAVLEVTEKMLDMGCYEVSLGDTIGVGTPGSIRNLLDVLLKSNESSKLALHCHDTYGQALANILMGITQGIRTIDSSVAGLGGCPYAAGASGNVASEDVVYMLHGMGLKTGIDLDQLVSVGNNISTFLGRKSESKVGRALQNKKQ
uniref:hydroxymethylglutaryl-CoA lyase n=1 Tax=Phallusia mammillata TaxID=59560 RepID=A0A6F9DDX7_9ASCI|nr:hydroxymethylglutaryl-CoA lyase, mitochondrial-like [Phallusia mammillata]